MIEIKNEMEYAMPESPTNQQIAGVLERIAELLEAQDENPFRVRAYRAGAQTIGDLDQSAAALIKKDKFDELTKLPNIGSGIAAVIGEYVSDGRSSLLDDLESKVSPTDVFKHVPGIGAELAGRIVDQLDIHTLEELEEAAHDGSLAEVSGFGERRVKAVQQSLAGMLSRTARRRQRARTSDAKPDRPPVELLLELDAEYRKRAEKDKLPKIAPRRFNPNSEAWLPMMRVERDGWTFALLFSNTAQAHELGKTRDWVVIYYERDGSERQNTVVTETQGALEGRRVVRGRERETRAYYEASQAAKKK
jgi:hypothetical protein